MQHSACSCGPSVAPQYYLADYVATFETMANAKRITAAVVQRICLIASTLKTQEPQEVRPICSRWHVP